MRRTFNLILLAASLLSMAMLWRPLTVRAACEDPSQNLAAKWTGPGLPSGGVLNSAFNLKVNKPGDYTATTGVPNCDWDVTFFIVKNGNRIITHTLSTTEKAGYSQAILILAPTGGNTDTYTGLLEVSQNGSVLARQQSTLNVSYGTSSSTSITNTSPAPAGSNGSSNTQGATNTQPPLSIPDNPVTNVPNYDESTFSLNPLIHAGSIPEFLASLVKFLLLLIAGLAVIVILIGAFRMAMSQGKSEALTAGKRTITWAIIGLVVALLSYSIVAILQSVLGI